MTYAKIPIAKQVQTLQRAFDRQKVILGVSACSNYGVVIWCTVPFLVLYNVIGSVHLFLKYWLDYCIDNNDKYDNLLRRTRIGILWL